VAVFIELVTDAFQQTFNAQKGASNQARRAGTNNARRPTRGLEVKDDTYAIIKVVDSAGTELPLIDSSSQTGTSTAYTNFILQRVKEARMEKNQIIETFGDSYIYFFGEAPRFLDVTAVIVDSQDFNWYAEWWANWDANFRGTKTVEMGARTYLFYDDNIVEGYMLMAEAEKTSDTPLMVQLRWRMFLTNYTNISFVGDPNFPVRGSLVLPDSVTNVNQLTTSQQSIAATLAANLQTLGFGGGQSLVETLQQGLQGGFVSPALQGILSNAAEAYGGSGANMPPGLTRTLPLRSLIYDDADEYTGRTPAPYDTTSQDNPDPTQPDPIQDAQDLTGQSDEIMQGYGAAPMSPATLNQLGLGPQFNAVGVGIGMSAGVGASASFGVAGGASYGVSSGAGAGIGGGFGFSGSVGGGTGYGTGFSSVTGGYNAYGGGYPSQGNTIGTLADQQNYGSYTDVLTQNFNESVAATSGNYQNGIQVSGGVTIGTGLGGGVAGGLGPSSLFTTSANVSIAASAGGGNGANINIGGTPSAFAMVSVAGTLDPTGFDFDASSFASANA
jgi:hypothetical protein